MAVIGGRAHLNGISFATNTHLVRGKICQGEISINVTRLPGIRIFNVMDEIPFLRGISKLLKLNLKLIIIMMIILALPWERLFPADDTVVSLSIWPVLAVYGIVLLTLVFLLKRLWQFHGAEHKAFNSYTSGSGLSLSSVKEASRISERCGTNLAIILFPILFLLSSVLYQMPLLLLVVSLSMGYEIFNWCSRRRRIKLVFLIAGFIQKYIVTAEPTEEQIKVAIATLSRTIECEERMLVT